MDTKYLIEIYAKEDGTEPFTDWMASLKDLDAKSLIFQRLQRIKLGNFGDCKPIDDGIWEFRIHSSSGYRIYYTRTGNRIILLLCAGNKRSQTKDVKLAKKYLNDLRKNR